MGNLKIGTRLGLGFAMMMLLVLVMGLFGINRLAILDDQADKMSEDYYPKTVLANAIIDNVNIIARSSRNLLLMSDKAEEAKERQRIVEARKIVVENFSQLEKSIASVKGKELLAKSLEARAKYVTSTDLFMKLDAEGKDAEAKVLLLGEVRPVQMAYMKSIDDLIEFQNGLMKDAAKNVNETYLMARILLYVAIAIAAFLGILIAVFITRSITSPMSEAVKIAQTVAKGDLTSRIEVKTTDETGQLLQALKDMNDNLVRIVGEVRHGTETIATASAQIATGNQDLSSRTEEQASSLEETASSMEELTSTVRQNGDNANQANQLAISAADIAIKGGAVVSQVVQTMGSINDSSRKIVDIISVIDGIAFQTNILALNAAVEAARAGEQGRGFAVVATEVRNLAQRSAAAAREIKTLIDDSVDKVGQGSKLVEQAGSTMTEIVNSIQRVTDIMSEITAATREQVDGIEQVNQAVMDMDTVTQQNAALVEEAAAAAESLQDQATNLVKVVSVFNTGSSSSSIASRQITSAQDRRGSGRATNVTRLPITASKQAVGRMPAKQVVNAAPVDRSEAGKGDDWEQF